MDSRLIKYSADQIESACQNGSFVCITFFEGWAGVEDVELIKVTAKCIWPKQSSQARVEKDQIGAIHWSNAFVIKGDEDQAIDTFYSRVIEEEEQKIAKAQDTIAKARTVMFNREILNRDPDTRKWVRS